MSGDRRIIPTLRECAPGAWPLALYPEGTAFEAGYLTQRNDGWRSARPAVSAEKCTACLQCYLYCPDGAIHPLASDEAGAGGVGGVSDGGDVFGAGGTREGAGGAFGIGVDLGFCKGCGICRAVCKAGAIAMEEEAR